MPYDECCGPLHAGTASAPTAEQLMRSRFSAFAVGDAAYLLATRHRSTRPAQLELDADVRWYRLDIIRTERGGLLDREGIVEFEAFFRSPSGASSQRETSTFVRENGRWYYVDGH